MFKKFGQAIRKVYRGQKGITGLETAIILIAFVTVAAVLAYTVLSAGIFSSERGKEAVYSGLNSAASTMGVKGAVIGQNLGNATTVSLTFNLALAISGTSVDLNKCVFNYWDSAGNQVNNIEIYTNDPLIKSTDIDPTDFEALLGPDLAVYFPGFGTGNLAARTSPVLGGVGDVLVIVHPAWAVPTTGLFAAPLAAYDTCTLQIIPPTGATITIQKTLPGTITGVVSLN